MGVTTVATPPEHADHCDGRCSLWLGTGTPLCLPSPCRCAQAKAARPDWATTCWWIKKATGRPTSRCDCWGRERVPGLPGGCCAHHPGNPRYAPPPEPVTLDDLDIAPLVDWERPARVDAALYDWTDPEEEFGPYEPLWAAAERTCDCPTPWDGKKGAKGWHCSADDCHQHFTSYAVGEVHRRRWTEPCRPPHAIVDIDTGAPLMYQGADGVWGPLYPTAE